MHRFPLQRCTRLPDAAVHVHRLPRGRHDPHDTSELLMFGRLFVVITIFFAAIAAFHQFVG